MNKKSKTTKSLLKFIIPSLIGVILFMTPVSLGGGMTIPIAFLANKTVSFLNEYLLHFAVILISVAAIGSILAKTVKPNFIMKNKYFKHLLDFT